MTDYTSWKVGDQIVCVDASPTHVYGHTDLVAGAVYTIRRMGIDKYYQRPCVWLVEVVRSVENGCEKWGEIGLNIARFRPIQKRQTDISCFKAILANPKIKISEDA